MFKKIILAIIVLAITGCGVLPQKQNNDFKFEVIHHLSDGEKNISTNILELKRLARKHKSRIFKRQDASYPVYEILVIFPRNNSFQENNKEYTYWIPEIETNKNIGLILREHNGYSQYCIFNDQKVVYVARDIIRRPHISFSLLNTEQVQMCQNILATFVDPDK